ncbi:MAG: hypothetical protein XU08_C0003G0036 [candidate division WWE3 bacterium CSP1-7]|uniref:Uncharacterized protein n=1 Tax=candidate division WWE3 bacterium CSP1-7 TaxID=1576480 RepID=A0A0T5ZX28_UNCKA|nr:MAG: hypothetical protein XU08_C0003G0036 [candidate division WWE3 bacterium CSP1-7]
MRMGLSAIAKGVSAHRKALLFGGLIFFLILALGAGGFRWWSHQEFEKFVGRIEGFSQQELTLILAMDKLEKDLKAEFDAISFKEGASLAENKKHLANGEKTTDEFYSKQTDEYLPLFEQEIDEVDQFLARRYLWLWGKEKEFLSLITSVSENATKAKDADAVIIERSKLLSTVSFVTQSDSIAYLGFIGDLDKIIASVSATTKALAPLKKYTTGYKFPEEDQIKTLYPDLYQVLKNYKALYSKTYEMFIAYANKDYAKTMKLSDEITTISKRNFDLVIDWDPLNRPFFQSELDAHLQGLAAVNLYQENRLGKVSLGERRLAASALVWAIQLYSLDHKDKYPKASNIDAAVKVLTEGKYLPTDLSFDQTTFSLSSSEKEYQLNFTDEVTGEVASITASN